IATPRRSLDYPYAVEIRGLDFTIGDSCLFHSLDLEIQRGKITGIWGRSGVGKSTLLNLLLGLCKPPRGTVRLFGHDVSELSPEEVLALVSVVEQEPRFFSGNIQEMTSLLEEEGKLERFRELAAELGMSDFVEHLEARRLSSSKLTELSGGERKRLGMLRGLLRDAPLVVLDEPTAFLDKATATAIMQNLKDRLRAKTIIVSSHNPLVRQYCDEVIELE
ncbi:MAG: ATP-binding cassette domain-containing protein, partial [Candidatus Zipacnadales bacterium]